MGSELTATPIVRDIVVVSGVDAVTYLQTQLTQDIIGLSVGESAWSFILAPKSEIEALVRVTRSASETVTLDIGVGHGPDVRKRLDRMLFRMDVSFEEATWRGIGWRGDGAISLESDAPIASAYPVVFPDAFDVLGPDVDVSSDVPPLNGAEFEALRIRAGWPAAPEFDGTATPSMTHLVPYTVNFDKGCYTGQEFVARVHYRDATPPRRLVRVSFASGQEIAPGAEISVGGEIAGAITSVEPDAGVGLGYLKRSVDTSVEGASDGVALSVSAIVVD